MRIILGFFLAILIIKPVFAARSGSSFGSRAGFSSARASSSTSSRSSSSSYRSYSPSRSSYSSPTRSYSTPRRTATYVPVPVIHSHDHFSHYGHRSYYHYDNDYDNHYYGSSSGCADNDKEYIPPIKSRIITRDAGLDLPQRDVQ